MRYILIYCLIGTAIGLMLLCSKKQESNSNCIDLDTSYSIKGVSMIFIIIHHLLNTIGYPGNLTLLMQFGYLGTATFFLFSGYGNWISITKLSEIKTDWLEKRIKSLYLVFLPTLGLSIACLLVLGYLGKTTIKLDLLEILKCAVLFSLPDTLNWFPKVMIVTLLVFYILFKLIKSNKGRISTLWILTLLYIWICKKNGVISFWYNSIMCFPLGATVAWQRYRISEANKYLPGNIRLLFGTLGMTLGLVLLKLLNRRYEIIFAVLIHVFFMMVLMVINVNGKFLKYIGKNSFEFYMIHIMWWKYLDGIFPATVYIIIVLVLTFMTVQALLYIRVFMSKMIRG